MNFPQAKNIKDTLLNFKTESAPFEQEALLSPEKNILSDLIIQTYQFALDVCHLHNLYLEMQK